MKKNYFVLLSILFIAAIAFSSCGKDEVPEGPDETNPVLTITKPASGAVFNRGGSILFSGSLTDNKGLKRVTISLTYNTPVAFVWDKSVSIVPDPWEVADIIIPISGTELPWSDKDVFTATIPTDILPGSYTITIVVEDAAGNTATKTIDITINE
jgi:hypothetical protein